MRLRERDHERLLPVGHEPGVHVGLDDDGLQLAAGVEEADAVLVDLEVAADLAEDVEEREHLGLAGTADEDVAVGRERRGRPARGLVAVEERAVGVAVQLVDALDADDPVGVDRDDGAHLLQDVDEIHDLGLDRRARELGDAVGEHGREQHLLGRADARVRKRDLGAVQAAGRRHADAARELLDDGAEVAQHLEVVVDGAVADAAAAEIGDERLAEPVQQRSAEQDRDAARARVRVDVGHVRRLDGRRVEDELALFGPCGDGHAVHLEQAAHDAHVADVRNVFQHARGVAEDRRDHRLRDEVLRALELDSPAEGLCRR